MLHENYRNKNKAPNVARKQWNFNPGEFHQSWNYRQSKIEKSTLCYVKLLLTTSFFKTRKAADHFCGYLLKRELLDKIVSRYIFLKLQYYLLSFMLQKHELELNSF